MSNKFKDFVEEIADTHPITPEGYINRCTFCGSSWAEGSYDEYLENAELLKKDPQATRRGVYRVAYEHHDEDCLWIKANKLVREP